MAVMDISKVYIKVYILTMFLIGEFPPCNPTRSNNKQSNHFQNKLYLQ